MPKLSRNKGSAWERAVATAFAGVFGVDTCRRNLQPQGGKVVGSDVITPLFHVEAKHGIKPNIRGALAQCEKDNPEPGDKFCIAVIKDNRKKSFVVIRFDDFLKLLSRLLP